MHLRVEFTTELKIEFVGNGEANLIQLLSTIPSDYTIEKIKLELHAQAVSNFNEKGLSLLSSCKESNSQQSTQTGQSQFPDMYASGTITEKDIIGEIGFGQRDSTGKLVSRYFHFKTAQFGLEEDGYQNFAKLCESIQKAIKPPSVVSRTALEDQVFAWVRDRFRGDTQAELIEYILPKLDAEILELEVWVPIAQLRVESDIHIGNIVIRPITEEVINQWRDARLAQLQNKENENVTEFFGKDFKRRFQGWPTGVIKLLAEPIAAKEIAFRETERSLAILRMFSVSAITPRITCYTTTMGRENIEAMNIFTLENNLFASFSEESMDYAQRPWHLDKNSAIEAFKIGLGILSELLQLTKLSEFQSIILDSVTHYSQATHEKDLSSKLVYLLAALEGIFLKNDTEPIQQNLGERIATLIGKDLENKKDIIRNIKATYGLRSGFLHHSQTVDDYDELEKFMDNAWRAMNAVIKNHNRFATKQDFISAIDDQKLAPRPSSG